MKSAFLVIATSLVSIAGKTVASNPLTSPSITSLLSTSFIFLGFQLATATADSDATIAEIREAVFAEDTAQDEVEQCDFWAENGECSHNPRYMLENCGNACRRQERIDREIGRLIGEFDAVASMGCGEAILFTIDVTTLFDGAPILANFSLICFSNSFSSRNSLSQTLKLATSSRFSSWKPKISTEKRFHLNNFVERSQSLPTWPVIAVSGLISIFLTFWSFPFVMPTFRLKLSLVSFAISQCFQFFSPMKTIYSCCQTTNDPFQKTETVKGTRNLTTAA